VTESKEAALDPRRPLLSQGDLVDHFEVMRFLGRGGMGEVYLARDTKLGRRVALKFVHPEALGTEGDSGALDRFMFEARATARFSHPHIVTVFGVGEHAGRPYLALEYLEGKTLRRLVQERGRLPASEAIAIAQAVAEALVEAHSHDLLHRDLKPENVIIPRDGRLRVLDFGLAKPVAAPDRAGEGAADQASSQALEPLGRNRFETADGKIVGTPMYMAPEQWLAMPSTAATDVWALGVMLFELLTGRPPFAAATACALCAVVCSDDSAPVLEGPERLPAELTELVGRCLDKLPGGRPQASEVVESLRRLHAPAPGASPASTDNAGLASTQFSAGGRTKGRTIAAIALAATAVAAVSLAAYFAFSGSRDDGPRAGRSPPADVAVRRVEPPSAPPRDGVVTISLRGVPEGATVFLDGDRVDGTVLRVARSSAPREIRVELAGRAPWTKTVAPDRNREVAVELAARSGPAPTPRALAARPPPRATPLDAGAAAPAPAPAEGPAPAAEPSFVEQFDPR
jgi:serine/threonine protein kinase